MRRSGSGNYRGGRGNSRSRSRDGGGRGGRQGGSGGSRSRSTRGSGGGGRRGGRGHHRGGRRNSGTAESGNLRERIQVESGYLVLIDQFMLANPQVIDRLRDLIDQDPDSKDKVIKEFGGTVVELSPSTYRIDRDPYASRIVVHQNGDGSGSEQFEADDPKPLGEVYVDTRCLAMIDRELLDDLGLLEKYQQLWQSGQDKACRDLLRDNGGAVRYGFQRYGDELCVYGVDGEDTLFLRPKGAPFSEESDRAEAQSSDEEE